MQTLLVTVLGQDRPGIIAAVAAEIALHQGNIQQVRQTLLQSVFGALLIVSLPDGRDPEALRDGLRRACQAFKLSIHVDRYEAPPANSGSDSEPYLVSVFGEDSKGLVAIIAGELAARAINITNLHALAGTRRSPREHLMIFEVDVPRGVDMDALRDALQAVAERLSLDIHLQHRGIFEAVSNLQY